MLGAVLCKRGAVEKDAAGLAVSRNRTPIVGVYADGSAMITSGDIRARRDACA
jgi:hypothetical protein